MTVYIVREEDCEENCILKVFNTKEKAQAFLEEYKTHWGSYYMDEYEVE